MHVLQGQSRVKERRQSWKQSWNKQTDIRCFCIQGQYPAKQNCDDKQFAGTKQFLHAMNASQPMYIGSLGESL